MDVPCPCSSPSFSKKPKLLPVERRKGGGERGDKVEGGKRNACVTRRREGKVGADAANEERNERGWERSEEKHGWREEGGVEGGLVGAGGERRGGGCSWRFMTGVKQ